MKTLSCFLSLLLITFFSAAHSYTVFKENGKVGLKTDNGHVLIPAQYEALGWSDGSFSVVDNVTGYLYRGQWGLIKLDNHRITKPLYEELTPAEGGLFVGRRKSALSLRLVSGCINITGKEVIPFLYDGIRVSSLRAIVFTKIGNEYRYGLIDLTNKTLVPQQYKDIRSIGTLRYAVMSFEGKTALFSENGKQITGFDIDSVSTFKKDFAVIHRGAHKGLIDRKGEIRVVPQYRDISIQDDGTIAVHQPARWDFIDGENKLIRQAKADKIEPVDRNLLKVQNANVVQLVDNTLAPVSDAKFSAIENFENGRAVCRWQSRYGVVLTNGKLLMPLQFEQIVVKDDFMLAREKYNDRSGWSLFDAAGLKKSNRLYESIRPFNGKFFAVQNRGYWGVINREGTEVIACTYDSLLQIKDGHVVVKFKGQYGVIDIDEQWIVTPRKNKLILIGNGRYLEYDRPTTILKVLEKPDFNQPSALRQAGRIVYFSDNKLEHRDNYLLEYLPSGTIWKIDMSGVIVDRRVFPAEPTEKVFEEAEGLRAIKRKGRYGFIDALGRLRIANRYEAVQNFSEGLAAVKILNKWGYINREDKIAIQPVYEEVFSFSKGFALVKQKGLFGVIDTRGKLVLPVRYENIQVLATKNFRVQHDALYGLANATGKLVIHPKYNYLEDIGNGYVIVGRDGKYGVVTLEGLSTIPLVYDAITYDEFNGLFVAHSKSQWETVTF